VTSIIIATEIETAVNHLGCGEKLKALVARLKRRYPSARVQVPNWDVFETFVALSRAKVIYREFSTFSYWAALASTGANVYYPTYSVEEHGAKTEKIGTTTWTGVDTPVLYPREAASLPHPLTDRDEDVPAVIAWLEAN
jgi:hypothetical protein